MQGKSKSPFADKFQNYVQRVMEPTKSQKLFNGQFTQPEANSPANQTPNPKRDYVELAVSSNQNSCNSAHSFNSSEFSYSKLMDNSARINQVSHSQRKRLKKLRELQENQCAICLDQIKEQCWLQCKHKFCLDCLQEWLKSSNHCPYCRLQLHHFWHKGEQFKVEARQFNYEGTEQQNMDWVCYNCDSTQQGDIVLICDRCEAYACHIECDPTLSGVEPEEDWFCHFCR